MSWIDAMAQFGIEVLIQPDHFVTLADRSSGWRWGPMPLLRLARYLRSGDVDAIVDDKRPAFLVGRRFTEPARELLTRHGIGWALDDGRFAVDGRVRDDAVQAVPDAERHDHLGAVALLLSLDPTQSQRGIAAELEVSQPLVHRLLSSRELAQAGGDPSSLRSLWRQRDHRPPPERQHWVADADPWEQVGLACDRLAEGGHDPVIGGEVAADAIAPWTTPTTAVVHGRGLRPLGPPFVPTVDVGEATVTVEASRDPLVHALAGAADTPVGRRQVAHPAIVARDLTSAATRDERVAEMLAHLDRSVP